MTEPWLIQESSRIFRGRIPWGRAHFPFSIRHFSIAIGGARQARADLKMENEKCQLKDGK
jgi:hypothetical protein